MSKNLMLEHYLKTLQRISDLDLLGRIKNGKDYTPEFLKLARSEVIKRGYDLENIEKGDIEKLAFSHKSTEELVRMVIRNEEYERKEVKLAIETLYQREYDVNSLLAKVNEERKTRPKGNVSGCMFTLNGIGTRIYGHEDLGDGSYISTKWIVFFFIPILPLASYRVLNKQDTGILSHEYEMQRTPLNRKHVAAGYMITLIIALLFLSFIIIGYFGQYIG